jgi:hypothetical protein
MTRGRCGWLFLQRMTPSFTTTRQSPGARRLTPRSSRGPTAGHQARAAGTRYIVCAPGLASCRRSRLNSNVRRRNSEPVLSPACPIPRLSLLRCNGENSYQRFHKVVVNRVLDSITQNPETDAVFIFRPHICIGVKIVDLLQHFRPEGIREDRATLKVPKKRLSKLSLRLGKNFDGEPSHKSFIRARASAHGVALVAPDLRRSRRSSNSLRHAWETERSSLPSKLSRRASTTAERSSGSKARASANRWSTRAFMPQSLALLGLINTCPPAPTPNPSLEPRPNGRPPWPGLRYAVHFLSPGQGVLPLCPAQLER